MGNHTVGVIVLTELMKTTDVAAVFAHPNHPEDGNLYLSVKDTAKDNGLPVFQFSGGQRDQTHEAMSDITPDLIVVADYRYLLKKEVLDLPRFGAINFHPSLLPKYRGRAPVNWAIINGEEKCGLTVHYMDEGMDSGDIIEQQEVEISFEDTIKDIHDKLFPLYGYLAQRAIGLIQNGDAPRIKQDHSQSTTFPRRTPEDGIIDWSKSVLSTYNFIRAITYPYPGAFSFLEGEKFFIWDSRPVGEPPRTGEEEPICGRIEAVDDQGLSVSVGDGLIRITGIQAEGRPVTDFSQPHSLRVGQQFKSKTSDGE